jgi:uncharacterized membrane protein affecting hemolysin expression
MILSLREIGARALALARNEENREIRDHLNLLCEKHRMYPTQAIEPFTDIQTARVRFLRRLYLNGTLRV